MYVHFVINIGEYPINFVSVPYAVIHKDVHNHDKGLKNVIVTMVTKYVHKIFFELCIMFLRAYPAGIFDVDSTLNRRRN